MLLGACVSRDTELPDPKQFIPPKSQYNNTVLGFEFKYAPVLRIEADDRGYDGIHVYLLYPDLNRVVFDLNVSPASNEIAMKQGAIPGTEGGVVVSGVQGTKFKITRNGEVKSRVLVKNEGWLYAFEGQGDTFNETLGTFRFTSGTDPTPLGGVNGTTPPPPAP